MTEDSSTQPIGWAIIGAGLISDKFIAPALAALPSARLVGVCSRTKEGATDFAARHGIERVYGDLAELLADPDVQVVYIATPNGLHADEVVACAAAGRHVLCDKPLALTEADAERAVAACADAGVQLGIMFQTRYYTGIMQARELVAKGAIGAVRVAQIEIGTGAPGLRGWRADPALAGMGATNNVGVHVLDALSFVLGESPVEVTAMTSASEPGGLETTAVVVLRYPSGALATASINQAIKTPRFELTAYGTDGRIDGHDVTFAEKSGRIELISAEPASFEASSHGGHAETVRQFNLAVQQGRKVSPSGIDGLASVRLVDAIATAARTGRVVSL
jgi:1,5-anhydro-D-fructose reductase (1,5-anhydro-D-mannitol-forming)